MFSVLFFRSNEMQPLKNTSCSINQFSAAKFKSMQYTERGSFSSLADKVSESLTAAVHLPHIPVACHDHSGQHAFISAG